MVTFHSYVKLPEGTSHQWPFQEPKLEVPTIYKAYFSGLCKEISPQNMAWNMVQYLHFRILEFPLITPRVFSLGCATFSSGHSGHGRWTSKSGGLWWFLWPQIGCVARWWAKPQRVGNLMMFFWAISGPSLTSLELSTSLSSLKWIATQWRTWKLLQKLSHSYWLCQHDCWVYGGVSSFCCLKMLKV